MNTDKTPGTLIKDLCDKYNFKTKFSGLNDNFFCNVYAKNTDGNYVFWFDVQLSNHDAANGLPFEPIITLRGNTDQNNIWLHETRKDLSLYDVLDFCIKISEICHCKLLTHYTDKPNEINIHRLVDIEDLQEFKDFSSLEDIQNYIDNHHIINKSSKNPYKVKIGFDYEECKKDENIINGMGSVYYYQTEEEYNACNETYVEDFSFKYNIENETLFDVECNDSDAKYRVENNEDDFIQNIIDNLLPELEKIKDEKNDIEMERDL